MSLIIVVSSARTLSLSRVLGGEEEAAGISRRMTQTMVLGSELMVLVSELTGLMTSLSEDPPNDSEEACDK